MSNYDEFMYKNVYAGMQSTKSFTDENKIPLDMALPDEFL